MTAPVYQQIGPCVCGCTVLGWKLKRNGHLVGCKCRPCIGGRNKKKGQAAQAKGHRALGGIGFTPSNEESHGGYDIRVQVEHKSGAQVPASLWKFLKLDWTRHAFNQAERAIKIGDNALPAVMVDGRWLIVDCKTIGPEGAKT